MRAVRAACKLCCVAAALVLSMYCRVTVQAHRSVSNYSSARTKLVCSSGAFAVHLQHVAVHSISQDVRIM